MSPEQIGELLQPFLTAPELPAPAELSLTQLQNISIYVDLLQRWNARINLTAVRNPQDMVTRHFGESLFLAAYLFPQHKPSTASAEHSARHALDFGSGAGFPGLPLKIYAPDLFLTLAESSQKKASFLAEAIRSLRLTNAVVFSGRIELASGKGRVPQLPPGIAPLDLVTLRAVERFDSALGSAAALIRYSSGQGPAGKLALLIGRRKLEPVAQLLPDFLWDPPVQVPQSHQRMLLVGRYQPGNASTG